MGGASSAVSKQPKLKNEHQLKTIEDSKRVLVGAATGGQQIHANPKGGSHDFLWGRGEVLEKHRWPSACRKGIFSINYSDSEPIAPIKGLKVSKDMLQGARAM